MKIKKEKIRDNPFSITILIVLIAFSVFSIYLLFWGAITAFKEKWDFADNVLGFPNKWVLTNFKDVINSMSVPITKTTVMIINGVPRKITQIQYVGFFKMLYNSLVITLGGTIIASIGPLIMGYVMGSFDYAFNKVLNGIIIFVMSFTVVGAGPAGIQFTKLIGSFDNIYGYVLTQFGWTSINTMMYAGIFGGVSRTYREAALLDGADEFTIMFKIMIPFAKNLYGTYFIIRLISAWNSYDAILMILPSFPTISYATYLMSVSKDTALADTPHRIATAVIMIIPTTTLFIVFRDKFLNNTSIGGIKG